MINQAPIVRYTASVCEILFSDFRKKTFSAESILRPDPYAVSADALSDVAITLGKTMCQIEDEDRGRLWTQHYPKRMDDIKSKAVCLTLFYVIADRAHLIYPHGDWSDKIQQALRFYGVSKEQYYEVGKDAVET